MYPPKDESKLIITRTLGPAIFSKPCTLSQKNELVIRYLEDALNCIPTRTCTVQSLDSVKSSPHSNANRYHLKDINLYREIRI